MPVTLWEKVRVVMHLPEGYTKVLVERTLGVGMADGGIYWDIPASVIPSHLRQMGSRFLLETAGLTGKPKACVPRKYGLLSGMWREKSQTNHLQAD